MNKGNLFACGLVLIPVAVAAEPASTVVWNPQTLNLVEQGNPAHGKEVAGVCEGCHGVMPGNVDTPNPKLRGQLATFLYKQLRDYKEGIRANDVMQAVTRTLSDQDLADVAAFYSRETPSAPSSATTVPESIAQLVEAGDPKRILPPCEICHGGSGQGKPVDNPALAGQTAAYLEQTLLDYKSGVRRNDIYGRMRTLAARLSDEEIKSLAAYYAGQKR